MFAARHFVSDKTRGLRAVAAVLPLSVLSLGVVLAAAQSAAAQEAKPAAAEAQSKPEPKADPEKPAAHKSDARKPAAAATGSGKSTSGPARGAMIAKCREHAHQELKIELAGITAKYEGKRVEGTYSVTGIATHDGKETAFKCSFNAAGAEIIEFYYDGALGDDLPPDDEPAAPSAADGNAHGAAPLDPDGPSAAPDGRDDGEAAPTPDDGGPDDADPNDGSDDSQPGSGPSATPDDGPDGGSDSGSGTGADLPD